LPDYPYHQERLRMAKKDQHPIDRKIGNMGKALRKVTRIPSTPRPTNCPRMLTNGQYKA
jgi:hypothetical protein